ncbi:uncharacterized protein [Coffea arabica]|uniref:Uncharacterized protein LOC113716455 n=1 Tax=Coffea arabica TaxID=13443 RepID=A0A6P6W7C9_COFAR|nr:uncharacterized protein LOC113716455 [Coffea arabica]XP_027110022.1 uncharacterized protein LOC113729900 [Coffea arabica]
MLLWYRALLRCGILLSSYRPMSYRLRYWLHRSGSSAVRTLFVLLRRELSPSSPFQEVPSSLLVAGLGSYAVRLSSLPPLSPGRGYLVPDDVYKGLVKIGIPLDSPTFYTVCEAEKAAFDEAENKREEEEAKDDPVDSDAEEGDDDDAADEADSDDADPKSETKEDVTAAAEENVKNEL